MQKHKKVILAVWRRWRSARGRESEHGNANIIYKTSSPSLIYSFALGLDTHQSSQHGLGCTRLRDAIRSGAFIQCFCDTAAVPLAPVCLTVFVTRLAPGAAAGNELDHITRDRENDATHFYWCADVDAPPASC